MKVHNLVLGMMLGANVLTAQGDVFTTAVTTAAITTANTIMLASANNARSSEKTGEKKMTVIQLVKSLEKHTKIKNYIIHFIDDKQCDFLKLNANELELEVISFHWNKKQGALHIYVEEVNVGHKGS